MSVQGLDVLADGELEACNLNAGSRIKITLCTLCYSLMHVLQGVADETGIMHHHSWLNFIV